MKSLLVILTACAVMLTMGAPVSIAAEKELKGEHSQVAFGYHRVSPVMQKEVKNLNGEELGTISDLVMDRNGKIVFALISTAGVFDIGNRVLPVPWEAFMPAMKKEYLALKIDKEAFGKLPTVSLEEWPKDSKPGWADTVKKAFMKSGSK